jgi:hypothetical protein
MPEGTLYQLINDALVISPATNTPHARTERKIFSQLVMPAFLKYENHTQYCSPVTIAEVFYAVTNPGIPKT